MNKLIIIVISFIIMIASIGFYYFFVKDFPDEDIEYMDVYYNLQIDIENDTNYLMYAPIPTNIDDENSPNPLVHELSLYGNISTSIKEVKTPYQKSLALEINGSGNSEVDYRKRFYENSSEDRLANRKYQVSNLYLLIEWDKAYIYFNSSDAKSCYIYLKAGYNNQYGTDIWTSGWSTYPGEILEQGWNEVELIHHFDGDV